MDEETYRLLTVTGACLALLGAFSVAAAQGSIDRPYEPPPGCELNACPSSDVSAEGFRLVGFVLIVAGVGVIMGGAAVGVDVPLSRIDEEALIERIERTRGRID